MSDAIKPLGTTPGPWSSTRSSSAGYDIVQSEVCPVDVCVISRRGKELAEINANALLVTAAPDLEQALCIVFDEIESLTSGAQAVVRMALVKAGHAELMPKRETVRHINSIGDAR